MDFFFFFNVFELWRHFCKFNHMDFCPCSRSGIPEKKIQEEKAHSATFCCRSRQLCLGGCSGDLREKRALSQRGEQRRNV